MPTNPLQFDLLDLAQPAGPHRPHSHTHRQPRSKPDASNPTGYAQTIEEITDSSVTKSYTLGLDVISQAINDSGLTGTLQTYLYDGHSSVRQLVDAVGQVVKAALDSIGGPEVLKLDYNAYGQAINFAAATAVSALLYSGEYTDPATGQQYLRARFYDPATGRFNRVDPFAGDAGTPQSLHKYLYGHGEPITNTDPSGKFIFTAFLAVAGLIALVSSISILTGLIINGGFDLLQKLNGTQRDYRYNAPLNGFSEVWIGVLSQARSFSYLGGFGAAVGTLYALDNPSNNVLVTGASQSAGVGFGATVSSSLVVIYNAPRPRDIDELVDYGLQFDAANGPGTKFVEGALSSTFGLNSIDLHNLAIGVNITSVIGSLVGVGTVAAELAIRGKTDPVGFILPFADLGYRLSVSVERLDLQVQNIQGSF